MVWPPELLKSRCTMRLPSGRWVVVIRPSSTWRTLVQPSGASTSTRTGRPPRRRRAAGRACGDRPSAPRRTPRPPGRAASRRPLGRPRRRGRGLAGPGGAGQPAERSRQRGRTADGGVPPVAARAATAALPTSSGVAVAGHQPDNVEQRSPRATVAQHPSAGQCGERVDQARGGPVGDLPRLACEVASPAEQQHRVGVGEPAVGPRPDHWPDASPTLRARSSRVGSSWTRRAVASRARASVGPVDRRAQLVPELPQRVGRLLQPGPLRADAPPPPRAADGRRRPRRRRSSRPPGAAGRRPVRTASSRSAASESSPGQTAVTAPARRAGSRTSSSPRRAGWPRRCPGVTACHRCSAAQPSLRPRVVGGRHVDEHRDGCAGRGPAPARDSADIAEHRAHRVVRGQVAAVRRQSVGSPRASSRPAARRTASAGLSHRARRHLDVHPTSLAATRHPPRARSSTGGQPAKWDETGPPISSGRVDGGVAGRARWQGWLSPAYVGGPASGAGRAAVRAAVTSAAWRSIEVGPTASGSASC